MALSMWFTNCMACGLMMPLVKAILEELEKMGIIETNEVTVTINNHSDKSGPRPTDFTIFYFLGIAYSSSIGGMATLIGSETNLIFKNYCELIFPRGPKLEGPHVMLLTLPGVLIMEMFLYLWLNFYFLGMLRVRNYTALQTTLTGDEEQYINILLKTQYQQLGKIKFHEMSVAAKVNPIYLMLSAALSTSLPFHLITGTSANAMVSAYVNIPPRKMMIAGIGPSIISILTNLFTVCVWSKAIWPDIDAYPDWIDMKYIKD